MNSGDDKAMRALFFNISLVLSLALLSGCITMGTKEYQGENAGFLVVTAIVADNAPQAAGYFFRFRPTSDPDHISSYLYYSPRNSFHSKPADFEIDGGVAYAHIFRL